MASFGGSLLDYSIPLDQAWLQGFTVVLFVRALHTIETGAISSKPASIAWAREALAPEWRGLLERSWLIREGQARGAGSAERNGDMGVNADDAEATLRFVRMALERAGLR